MAIWDSPYIHRISEAPTSYLRPSESTYETQGLSWRDIFGIGTLEGEPSLFEELEINWGHMKEKSLAILNPFKTVDREIVGDADLVGPAVFCLILGSLMLPFGKIHFNYIYEVGIFGSLSIYLILNLMSESGIDFLRTASILGYCLLPIVLLSTIPMLVNLRLYHWSLLSLLGIGSVLWCTLSSTIMFVTLLGMQDQKLLIAYPISMVYVCFVLMALL